MSAVSVGEAEDPQANCSTYADCVQRVTGGSKMYRAAQAFTLEVGGEVLDTFEFLDRYDYLDGSPVYLRVVDDMVGLVFSNDIGEVVIIDVKPVSAQIVWHPNGERITVIQGEANE